MIGLSFLFFVPGYRNKIYSYFCYLKIKVGVRLKVAPPLKKTLCIFVYLVS